MKSETLVDVLTTHKGGRYGRFRPYVSALQRYKIRGVALWEKLERNHLDPLLERTLTLWGDKRQAQQHALGNDGTVSELTADERQIHRSLYVSALSLGLATAGVLFYPPLQLLSLPGVVYASWQTYERAYQSLTVKKRLDITVFTAFVNTAYLAGGYLVWGALGNTSYFFSLKLLGSIKDRFTQDMQSALLQHPPLVRTIVDGEEMQRPLVELAAGDIVVARAGELIPVDGIVMAGSATVDQHILTGEARPIEKSVGDEVLAATILLTGALHVRLERAGTETAVGQLSSILAQTVDFRSGRQLFVQQLTDWLIPPFIGLAACTWPWLGFSSAAAVIDAHPSRQLNILGGLSLLNFLVVAAEKGILIKDAGSLEILSRVDTLIFDKTGTLTQERPEIVAVHLPLVAQQNIANKNEVGPEAAGAGRIYSEDEVIKYAAAAEVHQSHPIARAILAEAAARQLPLDATSDLAQERSYHAGFGIAVTVAGCKVHVGSSRFMRQEGITIPPEVDHLQETSRGQGHSLTMVALDGYLAGVLELQPALRPEVITVMAELRQRRRLRSVVVISGDQSAPTRRLAQEIGADEFYAEVLPTDKAAIVAKLQKQGRKVCFVGDGINDAIALKQANVSVSLQGATTAATDTAHVVLMEESLQQLPALFAMADAFEHTNRHTMLAILSTSAIGLAGIFALGFDLRHMTILDQIGLLWGGTVAMRPRLDHFKRAEVEGVHIINYTQ